MSQHQQFLAEFEQFARSGCAPVVLMQRICDRLHDEMTRYNWVGFYLTDTNDPGYLVLGPYSGIFTPHMRIAVDEGLCGAAIKSGKAVIVNDVSTDPRYLKGSEHTQSEIVVPFSVRGQVSGEFDINSYFKNTWDEKEHQFVEDCVAIVARSM